LFEQDSENGESYFWDFGTPFGADYSQEMNPEYTFPDTGHYNIMLAVSADYTCPDTTWMEFEIYGLLQPDFEPGDPQCFIGNSFDFEAFGASTSNADYEWDFGPDASVFSLSTQYVSNISYDAPDHYAVTLTIHENGCTESVTDSIWVVANPEIGFEIDNYEGCPDLYVMFNDTSFAETQLFYDWDFGDGTHSTSNDPIHPYTTTGYYDVTLTIYTIYGCIQELTLTKQDAVYVYPVPVADFRVNPTTVNILDAEVEITDESVGSNSCLYYMGDGGMSDQCNFFYTFMEGGRIEVTQYVFNEYGCTDHMTQLVNVEGYLLYAPNSFTPNGDGINDYWLPSVIGAAQYDLEIYNRWGEVIFETGNTAEAWTGNVNRGDHFAQDGVYLFKIIMHDLLGYPHDYMGHITLTR
jgi:gliding motility-associated-like protein